MRMRSGILAWLVAGAAVVCCGVHVFGGSSVTTLRLLGQALMVAAWCSLFRNRVVVHEDRAANELIGFSVVPIAAGIIAPFVDPVALGMGFAVLYAVLLLPTGTHDLGKRDIAACACAASIASITYVIDDVASIAAVLLAWCVYAIVASVPGREFRRGEGRRVAWWERCAIALFSGSLGVLAVTVASRGGIAIVVAAAPLVFAMMAALREREYLARRTAVLQLADYVEARMPMRDGHSLQIARISSDIVKQRKGSSREQRNAWWAARLADVGMLVIDNSVFEQQRELSIEERRNVRLHAARSVELIADYGMPRNVREIVMCHHERPDGKGYLQRDSHDVPRIAFEIAVADAFIAMRSARPHRPALDVVDALGEIVVHSGTQFDSAAAKLLQEVIAARSGEVVGTGDVLDERTQGASAATGMSVVGFDPEIDEASYRLSLAQQCFAAMLAGGRVALFVRDRGMDVDLSWLHVDDVDVWAPIATRVAGVPPLRVFRYRLIEDEITVADHDGSERFRDQAPDGSVFAWRAVSVEASLRSVGLPFLATAGIIAGLAIGVTPMYRIPSGSMQRALTCDDRVMIAPISPRSRIAHRDVIVFRKDSKTYVKRVIGMGGDHLSVRKGLLMVNGRRPPGDAAYVGGYGPRDNPDHPDDQPDWAGRIPTNMYFVLGDNRSFSTDSRVYGFVPRAAIDGRVLARVWPVQSLSLMSDEVSRGGGDPCELRDIRDHLPNVPARGSAGFTGGDGL